MRNEMEIIQENGQMFIVHYKDNQYETRQGFCDWVQKKQRIAFRSKMELISIINSVNC